MRLPCWACFRRQAAARWTSRMGRADWAGSYGHWATPSWESMPQTAPSSARPVTTAQRQPFQDEAFDLAVAYMCLHDSDDMPRVVAEVAGARPVWSAVRRDPPSRQHRRVVREPRYRRSLRDLCVIPGHRPAPDSHDRGGIHLTFHSEHRRLESYAQAVEACGLLIEAIREVKPPAHLPTATLRPGAGSVFHSLAPESDQAVSTNQPKNREHKLAAEAVRSLAAANPGVSSALTMHDIRPARARWLRVNVRVSVCASRRRGCWQ
jgi:hypothetical protein